MAIRIWDFAASGYFAKVRASQESNFGNHLGNGILRCGSGNVRLKKCRNGCLENIATLKNKATIFPSPTPIVKI